MQYRKELVSIIVVTFNHEAFIRETLSSIINQTYPFLEIIICDDGSTDNSQSIIFDFAKMDSRIIPLLGKENKGLSHNFNKGLDKVSGEYICFLGGDDLMLPQKIQKQVEFLKREPGYDVVLHWMEVFDSNTTETINRHDIRTIKAPEDWLFPYSSLWSHGKMNSIFLYSSYLARSSYALNSKFDNRLPYKNEVLFTIDNYMLKPQALWHTIPEYLGKYRIHPDNMHSSPSMNNKLLEEHYLLYAIAATRYPELTKKLRITLLKFQMNALLYNWVSKQEKKNYIKRLKTELGFLNSIIWYVYQKIGKIRIKLFG
jgi:glycosyltransferase involved in cell wall biosynthesis